MTGNPLIAIHNLSVAYDRRIVLHDVNLTVNEHDFLGIIGPNGGGKTTLIKTILGLLKPAGGDIRFYKKGMPVSSINMGYLPQYNNIDRKFPISVQELVLSGLIGSKKSLIGGFSRLHWEKVRRIISRMGLEGLENRIVGQLSGGQLQRAMLGRAIISEPQMVILDEPNTYIDKRFEDRLYELLAEINSECTIILINHDIDTVLQNAKSVACVNGTLYYHSDTKVGREWVRKGFDCPIDL
ncbi:High-affinity zinc uptake system ATP-binding protein ZnuC [termite gut metagenome]|uniref:High-affinity zinc uptake system ATP-binding protein ZnuC n=1 Tax=termite gut metagenome TaxID=433724 RepID=A0A5J4SS30_9ZZZZ